MVERIFMREAEEKFGPLTLVKGGVTTYLTFHVDGEIWKPIYGGQFVMGRAVGYYREDG